VNSIKCEFCSAPATIMQQRSDHRIAPEDLPNIIAGDMTSSQPASGYRVVVVCDDHALDSAGLPSAAIPAQQAVAAAVAIRGYREGYTAHQFAARQVAKLAEELLEVAEHMAWPAYPETNTNSNIKAMLGDIDTAGTMAKRVFNNPDSWADQPDSAVDPLPMIAELADLQVAIFCLAGALAEITGQPVDIVALARDKATADIDRGVR